MDKGQGTPIAIAYTWYKAIELIDGVEICNLLKELSLGVKIEEFVTIDEDWFKQFN